MAKKQAKKTQTSGIAQPAISAKYRTAVEAANKAPAGARVWKPVSVGDAVAGVILSHRWRPGTDRPWCAVTIDTGDEVVQARLNAVSMGAFAEQGIKVGAVVGLVYKGEVPSSFGAGRPAKLIAVAQTVAGKGAVIVTPEDWASYEESRGRGLKASVRKAKTGKKRIK